MMHGDAHVVVNHTSGKAKLDIYHSESQYDLIMWKCKVLSDISTIKCTVKAKVDNRPLKTKKCRVGYRLLTNFSRYLYNLYVTPTKFQMKTLVKPKALAVLWQDDGTLCIDKYGNYSSAVLCTDNWSREDLLYFRSQWNKKYGWCPDILNTTCRGVKYTRLRMRKKEMEKFSNVVRDHFVESMKYKLLKP